MCTIRVVLVLHDSNHFSRRAPASLPNLSPKEGDIKAEELTPVTQTPYFRQRRKETALLAAVRVSYL